jgi:hypothetical protein
MAINKCNGASLNYLTAKEMVVYIVEGVDLWATPAQWKRINKRARQMGLTLPMHVTINAEFDVDPEDIMVDGDTEVWSFLTDMNIMGLLDTQPWEDAPPMWGNTCMN